MSIIIIIIILRAHTVSVQSFEHRITVKRDTKLYYNRAPNIYIRTCAVRVHNHANPIK